MHAHPNPPPAAATTLTDGDLVLSLYTGPTPPPSGNAGDWWLPHYPDASHPHHHDGTGWELAAPDASCVVWERRTDLIALVFAAMTAPLAVPAEPNAAAA